VIYTQTVIDATQKETPINQQHSCERLICQRYQTILRLFSSAATASKRWRVRELNCPTTNAEALVVATREIGLEVSADKTKYMVMSRDQNAGRIHSVRIDNSTLRQGGGF